MAGELSGISERDLAVREFVRTRLERRPGPQQALPTTLLLGPRGSGKSALLEYLAQWARRAPVAHIDLESLGRRGRKPLDVLTRLVFQLNAKKQDFPKLSFPSFGVLLIAVATTVDPDSRELAVREMRDALAGAARSPHRSSDLQEAVVGLLESAAATVLGGPGGVAAGALQLLPEWQRGWVRLRTRRQLAQARRLAGTSSTADFLVTLSHLYNDDEASARQQAEAVFFDAFVADLREAYSGQRGDRLRTSHCLVLLDNADGQLGNDVLDGLLKAREKAGLSDPLLAVATAGSRPELLARREAGTPPVGRYLSCWRGARQFKPVRVDGGLHVGLLRDLNRREVTRRAERVLTGVGPGVVMPRVDDAVQWLGWLVHELTWGQPAATDRVLASLRDFDGAVAWDERLRQVFAPPGTLVDDTLGDLLPQDIGSALRDALIRSAAAVNLGQAGATHDLWEGTSAALRAEFAEFSGDALLTMRFGEQASAAGAGGDGGERGGGDGVVVVDPETLHPALRFLLLRKLAVARGTGRQRAAGPGSAPAGHGGRDGHGGPDGEPVGERIWDSAHNALAGRARRRVAEGAAHEEWAVAYHQLAAGDLGAAAAYLNRRFDEVGAQEWCTELCRLRRAPVRTPGGALDDPPRDHYEALVRRVLDAEEPGTAPIDERMKAIIRLLAASWISPEPHDDESTDRVGDPYRNPLGDPYAELYPDIGAEFLTLRDLVDDERDRHVYLQKSVQYKRRPWW